jgi:hypothetical protein
MIGEVDSRVRLRAFDFLAEQTSLHGDILPRDVLAAGFVFDGTRVPLLGPQGIFKPAILELPLSITTVPIVDGRDRPYADEIGEGGVIKYRYRGTDPAHRDNAGLRLAMQRRALSFARIAPRRQLGDSAAAVRPVVVENAYTFLASLGNRGERRQGTAMSPVPGRVESLCSAPGVAAVESADFRELDNRPDLDRHDRPAVRGVLRKGQMRTCPVVVAKVPDQDPTQVPFAKDEHMVQALAAD